MQSSHTSKARDRSHREAWAGHTTCLPQLPGMGETCHEGVRRGRRCKQTNNSAQSVHQADRYMQQTALQHQITICNVQHCNTQRCKRGVQLAAWHHGYMQNGSRCIHHRTPVYGLREARDTQHSIMHHAHTAHHTTSPRHYVTNVPLPGYPKNCEAFGRRVQRSRELQRGSVSTAVSAPEYPCEYPRVLETSAERSGEGRSGAGRCSAMQRGGRLASAAG